MDENLVNEAKEVSGISTMRKLVDTALREFIRHKRQHEILKLKGRVDWDGNLAEMRRGRKFA